jgi:hypothetical protein
LARRGTFKSDKRRKELARQQKQEEKRQRRFSGEAGKKADESEPEAQEPVENAN